MRNSERAATVQVSAMRWSVAQRVDQWARARGAGVFPRVEEETVEGAGGGEEKSDGQEVEAELWKARDGGDEDGGGEEDADGEFFGETMCAVAGQGARVNDEEPGAEQRGKQRVEAHGVRVDAAEQSDEHERGDRDDG